MLTMFNIPRLLLPGEGALLLGQDGQLAANEGVWEAAPVAGRRVRVQVLCTFSIFLIYANRFFGFPANSWLNPELS